MENYYTNSILPQSTDLWEIAKGNLVTQTRNRKLQLASLLLFVLFLLSVTANAQYSNVPVTGYNADVVANGATGPGINSTTADVDGVNWVFVDTTFNPGSGVCVTGATGLPGSRLINSITTPGLTYSLQPYNVNNSLRLPNGSSGTLTLTTPVSASNIYLLALGGSGAATITATITFTDLTTQTVTGTAPDWCSGTGAATTQFYRIDRTSSTCGGGNCQYLYDVNLSIDGPNLFKTIASIQISNAGGFLNVMAVGAKDACAIPSAQATAFTNGTITRDSISASFTAASPAPIGTGGYLVVRYPQGATPTHPVNKTSYATNQTIGLGTVVSTGTATTFTSRGLVGATSYDFYVYTYNINTNCGGPVYNTVAPLIGTVSTSACTGTLTGTVLIGPGYLNTVASGYTSITNALAEINANGLAGNTILELQPGYDPVLAGETFPITFPANGCVASNRMLTIRPASSVTDTFILSSNNAGATINLSGASYVTFDGRPGGAGADKFISIVNTNAAGAAIQFINDAHHNTFTYCDIQGQNTSATSTALSGVVYFATANANVLLGNDNNTLSFCDVHATTGGFPAMGIVSSGSTTNVSSWNDYNTITDCNIYDYFSASLATTGIKLENGSNAFTINNNHLYQTAARTYTTAVAHRAFWLTPNTSSAASPSGFIVTNNFIGGNSSAGTGTYTINGAVAVFFWGMDINHYGSVPSSVQGNTITNISVTSTIGSANDFFRGISTGSTGHVNIGTINGNIIGSGSAAGAITLSTTGSLSNTYGIKVSSTSSSTDTINVYDNTIGGIMASSTTAASSSNIYGIAVTSGSFTNIVNNLIGSTTVANSINSPNAATASQTVMGINVAAITNHVPTITNNIVANLNNGYASTSTGYTRGIAVSTAARTTINNNTVSNISSASLYTGSGTTACLIGIIANTGGLMTVSGNTVHSLVLSNASSTVASSLEGIVIGSTGSTPTHAIRKNFVHSFDVLSPTNTNAILVGMDVIGGANIFSNNMIRLGIKPDGTDLSTALTIRGFYLNTTTATQFYHNSIYIGGSNVGNTTGKPSIAFQRAATSGAHDIRNNVFVNERSNATLGAGSKHYQLYLANLVTLTLNNNIYYGTGNDARFATPNGGTNDSTVYSLNWANTGDVGSGTGNPQFVAPNASAALVDLHIHPTNPTSVESAGVLLSGITDDKDGDSRASNSPTDIGADAGNFVGVNMVIDSTVVDQNVSSVVTSSTNQMVVGIRIYTKNGANPHWVTGFDLHTASTSSNLDIENAKVFYTGSRSTFDTTSLFGVLNTIPSGAYTVTGSDTLMPGLNYFWVTYDVKNTATANNVIDARLDAITIVGGPATNILYSGDPVGSRLIKAPLNGNYDIGAGGAYTTITAAIADLKILGVSGPVSFTLKDALYNAGSGEVFPITINSFAGASAVNRITMFPGTAVTARIEATNATAAIDLNGVKYFAIDGRQDTTGGFTLGTNLQIVNTTGPSVRFINEASYNKLSYVDLKSNNTVGIATAGSGVVTFGVTTGLNGNDSNLIEYCDIHEEGSGFPLSCITSIGSGTTVAANNDGNIVTNCNIYNFFGAATGSAGIYIGANNGGWQITNNHVYQTALRTYTNGFLHRAFWITPNTASLTSASGFTINNNYIGGNAANGSGVYTMDGAVGYVFYAMDISLGIGAASNIQGNIITNINLTASNTGAAMYGINITAGNVLCGTTSGNIVGSTTTNGAISFTSNSNGGSLLPYRVGGGTTVTLKNNIASGISLRGVSPTISASFYGINLSGGTTVVADSNTVGSTTLANSINIGTNTSTNGSVAVGIIINPGAMTSHTVRYNQISNITNNYSGASTASSVRALHVLPSGTGNIIVTDNIVEQIKNAATSTGTGVNAATHGIIVGTTTASSITVSKNTVRSLVLTALSAAVTVNGIYYAGPTSGNHILSRNMVHSLSDSASNPAIIIAGIDIASGNVTTANNMVRLGIDSSGNSITNACTLRGISKGTNNSRVLFNTVYIGGTGVGADANRSFAFLRTGSGVDTVRNNIFINQRANSATGGGHFAVSLNNTTTLAMDYNLLTSADTLGLFNSSKQLTLNDWKSASGIDGNSISGAAGLLNPTGTTATIDLHISTMIPTPIENGGVATTGLGSDVDFDGDDRTLLTPTDIGADAGNFIINDIAAPTISYTALANTTATTDRVITATIGDVTGVYTTGTLRPRIYFKKMDAGAYTSTQGVLVSGTSTNGTWDFTISQSALGGIAGGDSIYYFVIAQDSTPANNVGSFPGGVTASDVNNVIAAPGVPSKYLITPFLSGSYTVGNTVPCNFPSLTVAINYIGAAVLAGPVILELMDPLYDKTTETFPIVLSPTTGASSVNNITIRPGAGVTALITDSITHTILDLNGIDYLTIDGRQGGTGAPNSLTIQNRSISNVGYGTAATPTNNANAIRFINDATFNTIKYANLEGASQTNLSGVVFFSIGTTVGNSNNTIQDCNIGNVPSVALYPNNIFVGLGTATDSTKFNRNVLINRNNIYNYFSATGESNAFKISKGNTDWTIDSNHFYQTAALTGTAGTQYVMNLNRRVGPTVLDDVYGYASLQNMVITNNIIGGSAPFAAGTSWSITGAGPNFAGIYGEYGLYSRARISNNIFTNFEMNQNTTGNRWTAISVFNGLANVDSNVIGSMSGLNAITLSSTTNGMGLLGIATNFNASSTTGGNIRISQNKIGGITVNGNATTSVNFTGINIGNTGNATQTYLVEKNTIGNELASNITTTGASTSATAQNMVAINTTNPANMIIRNNTVQNLTNTYAGTGTAITHGISVSAGVDTVSGNYISNLMSNAAQTSAVTSNTASVVGVQLSTTSSGNVVSQNTVRNLWNGNVGSANVSVVGINANGVGATQIANNNIYGSGVASTSAGASMVGVASNTTSSIRAYNNMVSLGLDTSGLDMQNAITIAGFAKNNTGSFAAYHNTVYIQGAGVGTNLGTTTAFRRSADALDTLVNNIFINLRSNLTTGGAHYALSLNGTNTLTSHHNILNVPTATPCDTLIGLDGNIGYLLLSDWQTFSGKEANSKDTAMAFVGSKDLHLNPSVYGAFTLVGAAVANIPTDIDGESRVTATPYIGADEITGSPLPVHFLSLNASAKSGNVYVVWTTASENNNKGFEVERSVDGNTFERAGFVKGNNKNSVSNYTFMDAQAFVKTNQSTLYYRLKQVDLDGKFSYSNKVKVTEKATTSNVLAVYPNPFNTDLNMNVFAESNAEISLTITDIQGRVVATQKATLVKGMNVVTIDAALSLQKGIYLVQTTVNGEVSTTKIIKQ